MTKSTGDQQWSTQHTHITMLKLLNSLFQCWLTRLSKLGSTITYNLIIRFIQNLASALSTSDPNPHSDLNPDTYLEFESGCFKIIFFIALNSPRNYISNPFKLPLNKIKITELLAKKQFF